MSVRGVLWEGSLSSRGLIPVVGSKSVTSIQFNSMERFRAVSNGLETFFKVLLMSFLEKLESLNLVKCGVYNGCLKFTLVSS